MQSLQNLTQLPINSAGLFGLLLINASKASYNESTNQCNQRMTSSGPMYFTSLMCYFCTQLNEVKCKKESKSSFHSQQYLDLCMCNRPQLAQGIQVVSKCQCFPGASESQAQGLCSEGFFPTPVPPFSFHCLFLLRGVHGWVNRICQPWEQSPSGSWLPIVEAHGCFRHPASTLWRVVKCASVFTLNMFLQAMIAQYYYLTILRSSSSIASVSGISPEGSVIVKQNKFLLKNVMFLVL